jgi:hypothetical protein
VIGFADPRKWNFVMLKTEQCLIAPYHRVCPGSKFLHELDIPYYFDDDANIFESLGVFAQSPHPLSA